jgi:predicted regulator of Ras-like GTPase activity (Roadblock/LC7/MglB family)
VNQIAITLERLCNKEITGSLVITKDGMVVESCNIDKELGITLGAYMSQIALMVRNSIKNMGKNGFSRYIIESNTSKMFLVDLGTSALLALANKESNEEEINVALFQAANELKKSGRLTT